MSNVSKILNSLGGVYRDTIRVSSEANQLLNNHNGKHLRPNQSSLMENNGTFHAKLLVFQGTISIMFRGNKYNIPMDIFLPPNFPIRPPVCFVRPTENMLIKENHRHVGRDGMVYMPYLHDWRIGSHNLTAMVSAMQTLFGNDPPVFSKPKPAAAATPAVVRPTTTTTPIPNINTTYSNPTPSSSTYATMNHQHNQHPPGYDDITAALEESKRLEEARIREQEMENQKLEEARRESLRQAEEERSIKEAKERLTRNLQSNVQSFSNKVRGEIVQHLKEQKKLEKSKQKVKEQLTELEQRKENLIEMTDKVENTTLQLQEWIEDVQSKQEEMKQNEDVDSLVQAGDIHSSQMIDLSCENASISDCMYFLDRALVKGTITLDIHLKQVRTLAKRQFLVRAHLLKIAEICSGEAQTQGLTSLAQKF